MIGSWSKLKRNVSWDWITTPLSWSSHIANLRKKNYLMLVLSMFLSTVFPFGEVVMQDYWMRFLKFKKDVLVLY